MTRTPDDISEQTRAKIRKFCTELAAGHALDPATRGEISASIEGKLTGYVSGTVRPTEEDALVLARAHFGDADRVAELLKGLSSEGNRRLAKRKRVIRKLAIALAVLTFVVPAIAILACDAANSDSYRSFISNISDPSDLVEARCILLFTAIIETGLVLAVRADPRQTWQRLTAAALVAPSILAYCNLVSSFGYMLALGAANGSVSLTLLFVFMLSIGFIDLVGHIWLFALLLARPPFDPIPLAAKV